MEYPSKRVEVALSNLTAEVIPTTSSSTTKCIERYRQQLRVSISSLNALLQTAKNNNLGGTNIDVEYIIRICLAGSYEALAEEINSRLTGGGSGEGQQSKGGISTKKLQKHVMNLELTHRRLCYMLLRCDPSAMLDLSGSVWVTFVNSIDRDLSYCMKVLEGYREAKRAFHATGSDDSSGDDCDDEEVRAMKNFHYVEVAVLALRVVANLRYPHIEEFCRSRSELLLSILEFSSVHRGSGDVGGGREGDFSCTTLRLAILDVFEAGLGIPSAVMSSADVYPTTSTINQAEHHYRVAQMLGRNPKLLDVLQRLCLSAEDAVCVRCLCFIGLIAGLSVNPTSSSHSFVSLDHQSIVAHLGWSAKTIRWCHQVCKRCCGISSYGSGSEQYGTEAAVVLTAITTSIFYGFLREERSEATQKLSSSPTILSHSEQQQLEGLAVSSLVLIIEGVLLGNTPLQEWSDGRIAAGALVFLSAIRCIPSLLTSCLPSLRRILARLVDIMISSSSLVDSTGGTASTTSSQQQTFSPLTADLLCSLVAWVPCEEDSEEYLQKLIAMEAAHYNTSDSKHHRGGSAGADVSYCDFCIELLFFVTSKSLVSKLAAASSSSSSLATEANENDDASTATLAANVTEIIGQLWTAVLEFASARFYRRLFTTYFTTSIHSTFLSSVSRFNTVRKDVVDAVDEAVLSAFTYQLLLDPTEATLLVRDTGCRAFLRKCVESNTQRVATSANKITREQCLAALNELGKVLNEEVLIATTNIALVVLSSIVSCKEEDIHILCDISALVSKFNEVARRYPLHVEVVILPEDFHRTLYELALVYVPCASTSLSLLAPPLIKTSTHRHRHHPRRSAKFADLLHSENVGSNLMGLDALKQKQLFLAADGADGMRDVSHHHPTQLLLVRALRQSVEVTELEDTSLSQTEGVGLSLLLLANAISESFAILSVQELAFPDSTGGELSSPKLSSSHRGGDERSVFVKLSEVLGGDDTIVVEAAQKYTCEAMIPFSRDPSRRMGKSSLPSKCRTFAKCIQLNEFVSASWTSSTLIPSTAQNCSHHIALTLTIENVDSIFKEDLRDVFVSIQAQAEGVSLEGSYCRELARDMLLTNHTSPPSSQNRFSVVQHLGNGHFSVPLMRYGDTKRVSVLLTQIGGRQRKGPSVCCTVSCKRPRALSEQEESMYQEKNDGHLRSVALLGAAVAKAKSKPKVKTDKMQTEAADGEEDEEEEELAEVRVYKTTSVLSPTLITL